MDQGYNTNPKGYGEIDMMEYFGPATKYSTHLHSGGSATGVPSIESEKAVPASHGGDASKDFHTYRMLWKPESIQIGVDDLSMGSWPPPNADNWHFNQAFYLIINFAVGPYGGFIPAPPASAFPAQMLVKWVWYRPLHLL